MKKEMKNWLRSSIVLALAAGALVGGSSVQAANTYDMTQGGVSDQWTQLYDYEHVPR